jgi:MATE family multidrug resistance protein
MLSYSAMTLAGTLFVGRLGASALAGISLGGIYLFTVLCFGMGLLRAVKVLVSQAMGAGAEHRVPRYLGAGVALAIALGLAVTAIVEAGAGMLHWVAESSAAASQASAYSRIRGLSAAFVLIATALREARSGRGDTQTPMRAALAANGLNIALDALFILGLDMGVAGAAWASVLAQAVDAGWLVLAEGPRRLGLKAFGRREVLQLWELGAPTGLQFVLEVGAFSILTAVVASISESELAAHQIAIAVCHFSFLPAFALGEAGAVLAGQAIGARRYRLVTRVARLTLILTLIYTGLCGLLFALLARPIAGAFTGDAAVIDVTVRLIYVAAAFQIFDGANIVARCVLRGTGDVRFSAAVGIVSAWLCTPPLALALGVWLGMGAFGGWLGLCAELVVGMVVLWWRLEVGGWHRSARRARRALREPIPESEAPATA